jgi:RND family efflux transporter MFP subunit
MKPARLWVSRKQVYGVMALLAGVGLLTASGCNPPAKADRAVKPPQVVVTTPIEDEVADYQDFTGRLDALKTVDIRAHVTGYVMEAPFKEGDFVQEGKMLFQIDPRPFERALNQAEANLKVGIADRNLQTKNAERARAMIHNGSIAREDYDTILATDEKSKANVGALEAARDLARLNLDYTHVIAPMSGRISRRFVDPGNLITADQTILTTLVSDQQLYAYFDVDERTYLNLVGSKERDHGSWMNALEFPVLMSLANEGGEFLHKGIVNFIDNRVIATTGTIRMRGVFDNGDGKLKSGLFVRIRLPIGKPYKTLMLPAEALQSDQGRSVVYVVDKDNQVVYRRVSVGQELKGLIAIKDGVKLGDRVIVSGMQRVRAGAKVEVKEQAPPAPPRSPLVAVLRQSGKPIAATQKHDSMTPAQKAARPQTAG